MTLTEQMKADGKPADDFVGFVLHTDAGVFHIVASQCREQGGMVYFLQTEEEEYTLIGASYSGIWPFRKRTETRENKVRTKEVWIAGVAASKVQLLEFYPQALGNVIKPEQPQ